MKPAVRISDKWWVLLAAGVMVAALIHASILYMRSDRVAATLVERRLENAQQLLRVRVAGLVHDLEMALQQEAVALEHWTDSAEAQILAQRWLTLVERHWALSMVALADEHGNETALMTTGNGLRLRETMEGSKNEPAVVSRIPHRGRTGTALARIGEENHDPRTQAWYGKALENVRDQPTWTLSLTQEELPALQASLLVRSPSDTGTFRILMFQVDPARSAWLDPRSLPVDRVGMLLMDGDGRILDRPRIEADAPMDAVLDRTAQEWTADKHRTAFNVHVPTGSYKASVAPYALNGQTIHTAVVMDLSEELPFLQRERRSLLILIILLVALALILAWLWYQRRLVDAEVRRQELRRRSQEQRLAKALGEREVLNREVHHRVKNNLQVMTSLLNLQAAVLEDGPVRDEFLRGKQRIDTISLVHHKLYALKDLRNVDLDRFLNELARSVSEHHTQQRLTVSHEVDTQGLRCDQDTAIGLGIIFCELMTNAYRHAFPYATGGHIEISVCNVEGDLHRLVIKDNGIGMTQGAAAGPGRLGLEIVEALAEQLDGSFHMRSNGGTTFEVLFRMHNKVVPNGSAPEPDSVDEPAAGL